MSQGRCSCETACTLRGLSGSAASRGAGAAGEECWQDPAALLSALTGAFPQILPDRPAQGRPNPASCRHVWLGRRHWARTDWLARRELGLCTPSTVIATRLGTVCVTNFACPRISRGGRRPPTERLPIGRSFPASPSLKAARARAVGAPSLLSHHTHYAVRGRSQQQRHAAAQGHHPGGLRPLLPGCSPQPEPQQGRRGEQQRPGGARRAGAPPHLHSPAAAAADRCLQPDQPPWRGEKCFRGRCRPSQRPALSEGR